MNRPTHGVPNIPGHHPHRIFANDDAEQIQRDPGPEPRYTGDELIWACSFTGLASILFTCLAAYLWGMAQ